MPTPNHNNYLLLRAILRESLYKARSPFPTSLNERTVCVGWWSDREPYSEGVGNKRRVAENAVIAAAPKRYKEDELRAREKAREEAAGGGGGGGNVAGGDALAMAMLGVKPKKVLGGKSTFGAATSKSMDVAEFLAKGPGGALLPRKKGGNDRMEQEKKKRLAAQNGRDSREWKSEAEMVLRQQYDS